MKKYILSILILISSLQLFAQKVSVSQQRKLFQTLSAISNLYVDTISDKKLIETTIKSVLENLDPHSTYIPKEEVQKMNEPLVGSFDGIGVQFQIIKDTINVVQTITGTPAEKVGVLPGDKIVEIEDTIVAGVGIKNTDILRKLRGKRGTPVRVKIKREFQDDLIDFKIIRDKIPLNSVDAFYMVTPMIGYIKINSFGAKTYDEFINALTELQGKGMTKLILDLQRNGGGYLHTAIQLANEFLSDGKLIVYTKGEHTPKREAKSNFFGTFKEGELVVLVDQYSASASEILSGAIQDWDRGVIIGRRTFGKGLVQREIALNDGSAIRLTIARYYTPTGRSIQKPYKEGVKKYKKDLINRYNNGELMHSDSVHFPDSLKYQTLELQRTVYGGGGIMPDIFVPIDTTDFSLYHQKIVAKGIVSTSVVQYMNKKRKKLQKKYNAFNDFNKQYRVPKSLTDNIIKQATKENIKFNKKEYQRSEKVLKMQLKALIARNLWGDTAYFQVINGENKSLQKAIEILEDEKKYNSILSSKTTKN